MIIQTGVKLYSFIDCSLSFYPLFHLKLHMVVHTCQKDLICPECIKPCSQLSHLKQHMMVHTEEIPTIVKTVPGHSQIRAVFSDL